MEPFSTSVANASEPHERFAERWLAMHQFGQEIGVLAALSCEELSDDLAQFPERIEALGGARWTLAQDSLNDMDVMLQPGLKALRTLAQRGQDTTVPALALWREFHAARSALLSLVTSTEDAEVAAEV